MNRELHKLFMHFKTLKAVPKKRIELNTWFCKIYVAFVMGLFR